MSLEQKIGKVLCGVGILATTFFYGCNITGSDLFGVGLKAASPYARNPIASSVTSGAGDLALINGRREHEMRSARAGATKVNVKIEQPSIQENYNSSHPDDIIYTDNRDFFDDSSIVIDFSPNGENIVFSKDFGENTEIVTANIKGENIERLTFTSNDLEYGPCWSPEGNKIAYFALDTINKNLQVRIIDLEEKNIKTVALIEDSRLLQVNEGDLKFYGKLGDISKRYKTKPSLLTKSFYIFWIDNNLDCNYLGKNIKVNLD